MKPEILTEDLNKEAVLQALLASDSELIVYKDKKNDYHILSKKPYNPETNYKVMYVSHEDLET